MSKVTNPLMSFDAHGQFGQNGEGIVFKTWRTEKIAVNPPLAHNSSNTAAQQVIRGYFSTAVAAWRAETNTVKTAWSNYANDHSKPKTGFNLYVGAYCKFLNTNAGTPPTVTNTPPTMS